MALLLLAMIATAEETELFQWSPNEIATVTTLSPLGPLPTSTSAVADEPAAALLGRALFFDTRLSTNGRSCATCHSPDRGFADGLRLPAGSRRGRHSPTLWNVAYQRWLFWDGRADSLWAQALGPLENPDEMASDRQHVARIMQQDPDYETGYVALFGEFDDHSVDRIFANTGKLIAAFERTLVSRRSPFDVFVEGLVDGDRAKRAALSPAAQRGLRLFIGQGQCIVCHAGPNFSDGEFHDLRLPASPDQAPDSGRYDGARMVLTDPFNALGEFVDRVDNDAADALNFLRVDASLWGQFKTPTLRNIAQTPPYMHDGRMPDLGAVIDYYSTLNGARAADHHDEAILTPRRFTSRQSADLQSFLESLTSLP